MLKKLLASSVIGASLLSGAAQANPITVDLELQLLADVSGSVNSSEYQLQLQGYSDAFRSSSVIDSILAGGTGSIAVQYIEWSGSSQQATKVDWTLIDSYASAYAFADLLDGTTRSYSGSTGIGSAIDYGDDLFFNNNFESARQVMDVSGDGKNNSGVNPATARDAALAMGVDTINGITIGNAYGLQSYYADNVIGGTNAFQLHADTFADFQAGIEQKLIREIKASVPEPASVALFGLGLLGLRLARKS